MNSVSISSFDVVTNEVNVAKNNYLHYLQQISSIPIKTPKEFEQTLYLLQTQKEDIMKAINNEVFTITQQRINACLFLKSELNHTLETVFNVSGQEHVSPVINLTTPIIEILPGEVEEIKRVESQQIEENNAREIEETKEPRLDEQEEVPPEQEKEKDKEKRKVPKEKQITWNCVTQRKRNFAAISEPSSPSSSPNDPNLSSKRRISNETHETNENQPNQLIQPSIPNTLSLPPTILNISTRLDKHIQFLTKHWSLHIQSKYNNKHAYFNIIEYFVSTKQCSTLSQYLLTKCIPSTMTSDVSTQGYYELLINYLYDIICLPNGPFFLMRMKLMNFSLEENYVIGFYEFRFRHTRKTFQMITQDKKFSKEYEEIMYFFTLTYCYYMLQYLQCLDEPLKPSLIEPSLEPSQASESSKLSEKQRLIQHIEHIIQDDKNNQDTLQLLEEAEGLLRKHVMLPLMVKLEQGILKKEVKFVEQIYCYEKNALAPTLFYDNNSCKS